MKKTMDDLFGLIDIAKPDEGLANLQLPSPEYLSYYKNLQDRIITLYDNIDIDTIYEYIENIIMFNIFINGVNVDVVIQSNNSVLKVFIIT